MSAIGRFLRKYPRLRAAALRLWRLGSGLYPRHLGVPGPNIPLLVRHMVSNPVPPGAVVEIGGGGSPYRPLLDQLSPAPYVCLDLLPVAETVQVRGDAHRLPLASSSVSLVTLFEVLEHLHSPEIALAEVARVLRPGGALILTVPQYWHVHGHPSDYFRYTNFGLSHLCKRSGLEVERLWPMGGPAILISLVIANNFGLDRDPIRRILLCVPMTWLAYLVDATVFRGFERRENPDTRGWALVARKRRER